MNAGGPQYTGNGKTWQADKEYTAGSWGYVGGRTFATSKSIANTTDDKLFQSERYRMASYRFTVPTDGQYRVKLYFAEIFYAIPDKRVFDVKIEGKLVLNDLDIFDEVGNYEAMERTFLVQVTDGVLDIQFIKIKDSPKISAIEVASQSVGVAAANTNNKEKGLVAERIIPEKFMLASPYPNPFNMETKIAIDLHEPGDLCVKIYNINGQLIKNLNAGNVQEGTHYFIWNGRDEYGTIISSGLYILRATFTGISGKHEVGTRRLVLMK
ncbi:hypothetical protein B6D60_03885 [candidate division KSB1 bacterium 4484_87]|nr:MAG: hypothetical protein B6D60_03885 [candidate division KSB1 bacterium 4484_87]